MKKKKHPGVTIGLTCGGCKRLVGDCVCVAGGKGTKYDAGKLRYDLVDPKAYAAFVEVMTIGAQKYAPNNWRSVEDWKGRYSSALMRHLEAWRAGEMKDMGPGGIGSLHLAQVMWNAHALLALTIEEIERKGKNGRR